MIGIYKIENKETHKVYIGQSLDIQRRLRQHKNLNETFIDKEIQRLGVNSFTFEILEECNADILNEREKYWIDYYNSFQDGYNNTRGGKGTIDLPIKLSVEDVMGIYDLLINSTLTQNEIAARYNVGADTISEINQGKTRVQLGYSFPLRNNKREPKEETPTYFFLTKEQLIADFIQLKSFSAIGRKYGVSPHPVRNLANKYGFTAKSMKEDFLKVDTPISRPVIQFDMSGNIIREFSSTSEASRIMGDKHIKQVCDGKRLSSKGYKYQYKD